MYKIILAITGASGSIYARQVLERLLASEQVSKIALIVSARGKEVWDYETTGASTISAACSSLPELVEGPKIETFDNADMFAPVASGSARWDAMAVVPCSMGCVGRLAAGVSTDLIARAADVMLKEGRTLVVVPRETPLSLIHLRNLVTLAEAGAVVMPAAPSLYSHPADIEQLAATVSERIVARLGIDTPHFEWGKL